METKEVSTENLINLFITIKDDPEDQDLAKIIKDRVKERLGNEERRIDEVPTIKDSLLGQ